MTSFEETEEEEKEIQVIKNEIPISKGSKLVIDKVELIQLETNTPNNKLAHVSDDMFERFIQVTHIDLDA